MSSESEPLSLRSHAEVKNELMAVLSRAAELRKLLRLIRRQHQIQSMEVERSRGGKAVTHVR